MSEEKIEVVYFDGDPIVYRNGSQLNEKEIVNLLVEYFEDCDILIKENESLKEKNDFLEIENESLEDGATKYAELYHKSLKEIEQLNKKLHIYKSDGLETLNDLQRCYENAKKATKTIDALYEENEQLKQRTTQSRFTYEYDEYNGNLFDNKMNTFYHIEDSDENIEVLCDRLNWLVEENEQLKQDVEYWKQVASQYINGLNIFEQCKKYKTEYKDVHWSSD